MDSGITRYEGRSYLWVRPYYLWCPLPELAVTMINIDHSRCHDQSQLNDQDELRDPGTMDDSVTGHWTDNKVTVLRCSVVFSRGPSPLLHGTLLLEFGINASVRDALPAPVLFRFPGSFEFTRNRSGFLDDARQNFREPCIAKIFFCSPV